MLLLMMMMMMMSFMVMLYDDGKVWCPVMHFEIVMLTAALDCCFKQGPSGLENLTTSAAAVLLPMMM